MSLSGCKFIFWFAMISLCSGAYFNDRSHGGSLNGGAENLRSNGGTGYSAANGVDPITALGVAIAGGGVPGEDYPILASVPDTGFECDSLPGYYADTSDEAQCQVFHICQEDGRLDSFLCPNGTLFNQQYFVCDWWFNVDCANSDQFFGLNAEIGNAPDYSGTGSFGAASNVGGGLGSNGNAAYNGNGVSNGHNGNIGGRFGSSGSSAGSYNGAGASSGGFGNSGGATAGYSGSSGNGNAGVGGFNGVAFGGSLSSSSSDYGIPSAQSPSSLYGTPSNGNGNGSSNGNGNRNGNGSRRNGSNGSNKNGNSHRNANRNGTNNGFRNGNGNGNRNGNGGAGSVQAPSALYRAPRG